jgi:D-alanine-D-alanine ligase
MGATGELDVRILCGDPRLAYEYGVDGTFSQEEVEAVERACHALSERPGYQVSVLDDHTRYIDELRANPPDLVLNFCDTGYRNQLAQEPNIPAFLEMLDIPYTGAPPAAMHLCGDKSLVRHVAAAHSIPVPNEKLVDLNADPLVLPDLYPAMIKPNGGCGSMGIAPDCVVHDGAEADAVLRRLAGEIERPQALIQDFLTGPEYTLGLVGNPDTGFTVLPTLEVDYSDLDPELPPILAYGSKADPASDYWRALRFRQAEVSPEIAAQMIDQASFLFGRLGFRDYARIDFRAGADGIPRLLDANFNPTWNWDGKMAIMAGWHGMDYGQLLEAIVKAARQRHGI